MSKFRYGIIALAFYFSVCALAYGCIEGGASQCQHSGFEQPKVWDESFIDEFEYEGCQYVYFRSGSSSWGAHKGNCSNLIHKYNE